MITGEYKMSLLEKIKQSQLMVAIRTDTPEQAYKSALACIEGGIKLVEITFSVPEATEVIKRLSSDRRAIVGAGTVLSIAEARRALKAGAEYLVSPGVDEKVVRFTKKEGAISIPGACTPTEIHRAHSAGGDIIKLFPFVEIGGFGFLKAVRGPFPFINYMLSGGMTLDNISKYLTARAAALLVGSAIIKRGLVETEDWLSMTELAKEFVSRTEELIKLNSQEN